MHCNEALEVYCAKITLPSMNGCCANARNCVVKFCSPSGSPKWIADDRIDAIVAALAALVERIAASLDKATREDHHSMTAANNSPDHNNSITTAAKTSH